MNEMRERDGRDHDNPKETAPSGENQPGTRKPETRLNQSEAAAESLRRRFLQADNKFYFRGGHGEANKVAFDDHGKRLTTEHDDPTVIHGMVLRAQEKGWSSLRVKGSEEFKAEAWIQATIAGIEVEGYQPRAIDRMRLEERKGEIPTRQPGNIVEQVEPRVRSASPRDKAPDSLTAAQRVAVSTLETILRERGDSPAMIKAAVGEASARFSGERLVVGKVIAQGIDHYDHNKSGEKSYYVRVATAQGEKEVWGVDLARAMEQSGAKTGDAIALIQRAHERVTVQVPVKNDAGEQVGTSYKPAKRNTWEVMNLQTYGIGEREQVAATSRMATHQPVVNVFDPAASRTDQRLAAARVSERERERDSR